MKLVQTLKTAAIGGVTSVLLTTTAVAEDITLKLAGVLPVEHYSNQLLLEIEKEIEEAGVGLQVDVFPAAQLGSGEELFESAIRGNIDLVHALIYAHKDPVLEMNSLPYLVTSWEDMKRVYGSMDSAYSRILTERLENLGLVLISNAVEGFIGVVTTEEPQDPVGTGEKGLNIRVWPSQIAKATTESLGYRATSMNWGETFAAIQSGAVDGAICCTAQATYTVFAQSDVGQYFIPYNAFVEASSYYASARTWEKLNDEQKEAVRSAMSGAAQRFNNWAQENDESYISKLKEKGWNVIELTDEERAALAAHTRETVWPSVADVVGQDVIDQLLADNN